MMSVEVPELASRYWDLQNYVTGFAIIQMVAALLAMATSKEMATGVDRWRTHIAATMFVTGLAYIAAVTLAFFAERHLSRELFEKAPCILWVTFIVRVLAVAGASAFGIVVVKYAIPRSGGCNDDKKM